MRGFRWHGVVAGALAASTGCSPTLDWREVRPEGGVLTAMMPCKPERRSREVELAGAPHSLQVIGCAADGTTWGVATADVGDPGQVAEALAGLRAARSRNLDGRESAQQPARVPGMTSYAGAVRFTVDGRRPDGTTVQEHSIVFAQGTRVFHAAALGGDPSDDTIEAFFAGLELRR